MPSFSLELQSLASSWKLATFIFTPNYSDHCTISLAIIKELNIYLYTFEDLQSNLLVPSLPKGIKAPKLFFHCSHNPLSNETLGHDQSNSQGIISSGECSPFSLLASSNLAQNLAVEDAHPSVDEHRSLNLLPRAHPWFFARSKGVNKAALGKQFANFSVKIAEIAKRVPVAWEVRFYAQVTT